MTTLVSQGVEELINKLKNDGINEGKERAERLINDAHKQASNILDAAIKDADKIRAEANTAAENELLAGKNNLKMAARDMVLEFRNEMTKQFKKETKRLVSESIQNKDVIYKLLLLICAGSLEQLGDDELKGAELLVTDKSIDTEAIANKPKSITDKMLKELVFAINANMLQKGITFGKVNTKDKGIYVKVDSGNVIVDFTDESLTKALLKYLQPRFRAILEGLLNK